MRRAYIFFTAVLVLTLLGATFIKGDPANYSPSDAKVLIAHAGGGLPHATYTNSLEAMDLAARNGFCLVEIDFRLTSGGLVLARTWMDTFGADSVAALLVWMERHPHVRIITDTKLDNLEMLRALTAKLGGIGKDRFIVQIYDPNEIGGVRALGFSDIILTLYKGQLEDDAVLAFALEQKPFAITIPVKRVSGGDLAGRLSAEGILALTHTVNDPKQASALAGKGVSGFYTDYLTPADNCASDMPT